MPVIHFNKTVIDSTDSGDVIYKQNDPTLLKTRQMSSQYIKCHTRVLVGKPEKMVEVSFKHPNLVSMRACREKCITKRREKREKSINMIGLAFVCKINDETYLSLQHC